MNKFIVFGLIVVVGVVVVTVGAVWAWVGFDKRRLKRNYGAGYFEQMRKYEKSVRRV